MRKLFIWLLVAGFFGVTAVGEEAVSGSLGLECTFTLTPVPAPFEVDTAVRLSISFAGAEIVSRTEFSWNGLEAESLSFGMNLNGVILRTGMRFDPCFSQYRFEIRGGFDCFDAGALLIVGNLAPPCLAPAYAIGTVLDFGACLISDCCGTLSIRSLTGFGVRDLYLLIDDDPRTDASVVSGFLWEEQLIYFGLAMGCLRADAIILVDQLGFAWARLGTAYIWPDPELMLGTRVWIDYNLLFDYADLTIAMGIDPIKLRSVTTFDLTGILVQEIDLSVFFSWVRLYSRTVFDFPTTSITQTVGIEFLF